MTRADVIVTILTILALAALWLVLIYLWFVPR